MWTSTFGTSTLYSQHIYYLCQLRREKRCHKDKKKLPNIHICYILLCTKNFWSKMFMKTFLKRLYSIYKRIPICRFLIRQKPSKNSRLYCLLLLLNHSILFFLGSSQKSASFRTAQAKQTLLLS